MNTHFWINCYKISQISSKVVCFFVFCFYFVFLQNMHHLKHSRALFHSLSRTRSHEEALLRGTFTFFTFNTSSLSFASTNSTATPPMAFLRSWGCVHFLVLFNLGSESHALDSNQTLSLPESGMFVTSTGLDRFGQVTLQSITLQPHEAIVIKLFKTDPDFWESGNKWFCESPVIQMELTCFYNYCILYNYITFILLISSAILPL